VRNYCRRGITFARVVAQIDRLHFADDTDVHVLSEIYEDLLKQVAADSAGYAGEFYTQRHIVRAWPTRPMARDRLQLWPRNQDRLPGHQGRQVGARLRDSSCRTGQWQCRRRHLPTAGRSHACP